MNDTDSFLPEFCSRLLAMLRAPRVRRNLLFYTIVLILSAGLWMSLLGPMWTEHRLLKQSVDRPQDADSDLFGGNVQPEFPHTIYLKDLEPQFMPKALASQDSRPSNTDRLIFVGDVGGSLPELKQLLEKVNFDANADHLVFTGNLVDQVSHAADTIDFVRNLGASCVRGLNEDRLLLMARSLDRAAVAGSVGQSSYPLHDSSEFQLATQLPEHLLAYLESCPVILRIGFMEHLSGELVVVHAGLVPQVPLEQQDATSVMLMQSVDLRTNLPSARPAGAGSVHWPKVWNKWQKSLLKKLSSLDENEVEHIIRPITVIYGHDAQSSPNLQQYSKGIDTGCKNGGRLTALILTDDHELQVAQVACRDQRDNSSSREWAA